MSAKRSRGPAPRPRARRRRPLVLWSAAAALLAAAALGVHEVRSRPVASVKVSGELVHTDREALEAAVAARVRTSLYRVDVRAVRRAALALPWVREVSVRRVWPDSLTLDVTERVAVARWGEGALIEEDASVFSPGALQDFAGLPQLEGPPGTAARMLDHFWTLQERLRPIGWRISRLTLDRRDAWEAEIDNGVQLVLGQGEDTTTLESLVRAFNTALLARTPQRIDLRYANGFAIRWKEGPAAQTGEGQG